MSAVQRVSSDPLPVPQPGTSAGRAAWRSTAPTASSLLAGAPRRRAARSASGCAAAAAAEVRGWRGRVRWHGGRRSGRLTGTLPFLFAGSGLEYILLALTGPLFLGALAIYHRRKRLRHDALADSPLPTLQAAAPTAGAAAAPWYQVSARGWDGLHWTRPCSPQVTALASSVAKQSPEHRALLREQPSGVARLGGEAEPPAAPEPCSTLLQGSQLYAVINAVPVRRWKEFMRVLELREAEIELVELEVAHIRDQQYEMLKRWCQQTSATLDRVFAALERMELAGCAEALRRSLLAGP